MTLTTRQRIGLLTLFLIAWSIAVACGEGSAGAKPILEVWSPAVGPRGLSGHVRSDRFWNDYRSDREFRGVLDAHFAVRWVNATAHPLAAVVRGNACYPTYVVPAKGVKFCGYQSKDRLLLRLGFEKTHPDKTLGESPAPTDARPAAEEVQPPPVDVATKQDLQELSQAVDGNLTEYSAALDRVEGLLSQVNDRDRRTSADVEHRLTNLRAAYDALLQAHEQTPEQLAHLERRLLAKLTETRQDDSPSPSPSPDDPVGTALRIGRIPAALILGPAGGAGLTAAAWVWSVYRRRKRSRDPPDEKKKTRSP